MSLCKNLLQPCPMSQIFYLQDLNKIKYNCQVCSCILLINCMYKYLEYLLLRYQSFQLQVQPINIIPIKYQDVTYLKAAGVASIPIPIQHLNVLKYVYKTPTFPLPNSLCIIACYSFSSSLAYPYFLLLDAVVISDSEGASSSPIKTISKTPIIINLTCYYYFSLWNLFKKV